MLLRRSRLLLAFRLTGFRDGHQFPRCDLALFRLCQFDNQIDDLFLKDRRPQIVHRVRLLAVEVENLALITGMTLGLPDHRLVTLLLSAPHFLPAPPFANHPPQPTPPSPNPPS